LFDRRQYVHRPRPDESGHGAPGYALIMQANIEGEQVSIVLLNSFGKLTPFGDSNRLRKWMLAKS